MVVSSLTSSNQWQRDSSQWLD